MSYDAGDGFSVDILSAEAIKSPLPADFSGDIVVKEITESTNSDAARLAKDATHVYAAFWSIETLSKTPSTRSLRV